MRAQIVLENVGIRFPNRTLFEGVNWTLYEGMRVAFAGRNGSGKSTLLKLLAGATEPQEGRRTLVGRRSLNIGYLDQSLLDTAVLEANDSQKSTQSPLVYIEKLLRADTVEDHEAVEWEIKKVLSGLGFTPTQMQAPISELSGGWLLRMFIGATLLQRPEVLLLDEPTNHLDMSSIQWLEEFLKEEYRGSLVLITHDVDLQRRTTDALAVLHGGHFYFRDHQHDYISFMTSLKDEERILEKNIEGLEKKIKEHDDFILQFRAKARMASRASSKQKSMEKLEEECKELKDRLARVKGFSFDLHFKFRMEREGAKFPLSIKNLHFQYPNSASEIIKGLNTDIKQGQKIAIIGDNGAGKTTLLNLLAQRLTPTKGEIEIGYGVDLGYFGQHQLDELTLDQSVLDNLRNRAIGIPLERLRGWLGAFGFQSNDEVEKKAKVLSGGERARLALLRILATPCNICLLDEPTNHLDIETKELLKQAIIDFSGSIVFVSHDREFIRGIAQRILYLTADHKLIDHLGTLDTFFEKYPEALRHLDAKLETKKIKEVKTQPTNRLSFEERKQVKNRVKSLERKISEMELEMDRLGQEKITLQQESEKAGFFEDSNAERKNQVLKRISDIDSLLNKRMVEWEKLGTELETNKTQLEGN